MHVVCGSCKNTIVITRTATNMHGISNSASKSRTPGKKRESLFAARSVARQLDIYLDENQRDTRMPRLSRHTYDGRKFGKGKQPSGSSVSEESYEKKVTTLT